MTGLVLILLLMVSVIPLPASGQNLPYQTYEIGVGQTGGFGGLNLNTSSTQLAPNEAQLADNIWQLRDGAIAMRPGFSRINATSISAKAPWLIYRKNNNFLVGDSNFIWKLGNGGEFNNPDSILGYNYGTVSWTSGTNIVGGIGGTDWSKSVQIGDIVAVGAKRQQVIRVKSYDSLWIQTTDNTVTSQPYRVLFNYGTTPSGSIVQFGNNLIGGSRNRAGFALSSTYQPAGDKQPVLLGHVWSGTIDTVSGPNTNVADAIKDKDASFTANEWAGYWLLISQVTHFDNVSSPGATTRSVSSLHVILSNTATKITTKEHLTSRDTVTMRDTRYVGDAALSYSTGNGRAVEQGDSNRYSIFAPVGTFVDSFTIDTVNTAARSWSVVKTGYFAATDSMKLRGHIVEFLSGDRAGQFFSLASCSYMDANSIRLYPGTTGTDDATSIALPTDRGQKIAIWQAGVAADQFLVYNNQLVAANSRLFSNQIRFSVPGTIHEFAPLNYRVLPADAGAEIKRIADLNGDFVAWQGADTWKIPGTDLSTGQLIHSLSGIGCPAPRSLVFNGNQATWLTLAQGEPKVISWNGGTIGFNTVGQSSVFGGGGLTEVSAKIAPRLGRTSIDSISRAAAGLWQDHYILSYPMDGKDTNAASVGYHIPSGRWTTFDSGVALAASYFFNASSSPDSGQLYFAHPNRGIIYQFGNAVSDTNAYTRFATWISKDFHFQNYRELKQLMNFGLDYEKHTSLTGGNYVIKAYKNLPGTQFKEGASPYNPLTFSIGTDSTGTHSESRWVNTGAFFRSVRFGLNIAFVGSAGAQNNDLKLNGFRFSVINLGGL